MYYLIQFQYKTCSIVVCFCATCMQLLISLASNQTMNICEVGMLRSVIVHNWTLYIT